MSPTTQDLLELVNSTKHKITDNSVVAAVRTLLLDHAAVAINGSQTETSEVFRKSQKLTKTIDLPLMPIFGIGSSSNLVGAAMANALAAHSIEYDDVHNASSLHPGVVIFPAAMTAALISGGNEIDVIRGVVAGYEAMCRIGHAANPPSHYARNFHPTGTVGTLGAAVAAGSAMNFDIPKLNHAVGIACSMASGSMQFLVDGAWTKRLHPALAVRNGLDAAFLAKEGFIGTKDGVCGDRGFLVSYSANPQPELLLGGGKDRPLEVVNTSIKAHTCCRYNQGAIDAMLKLRSLSRFTSKDISSIVVGVPSAAVGIVLEPSELKKRPRSVVDAQFSLPFAIAVAMRHGEAGLKQYTDEEIESPENQKIMEMVTYQVDADIDACYPEQWKAWVRVETSKGEVFQESINSPKGDPENPLSSQELSSKYRSLTNGIMSSETIDELEKTVACFGDPGTFSKLLEILSY